MAMATTYTTTGSVRGSCGHTHESIATARKCLERDRSGCKAQGGYSDRSIVRTDGQPLDETEMRDAYESATNLHLYEKR